MSLAASSWALNEAALNSPTEAAVLFAMADRARDDGTSSYQSVRTIAARARVSESTCRRCLQTLEARGVITRGDQSQTGHLRPDRRPVVYDLAMPDRRTRLSPQPEERGVTLTPRGGNGVSNEALRGVKSGVHGVSPVTDKTSTNPKTNPSVVARSETPDGAVAGCARHANHRRPLTCPECARVLPPRRDQTQPVDQSSIRGARDALRAAHKTATPPQEEDVAAKGA